MKKRVIIIYCILLLLPQQAFTNEYRFKVEFMIGKPEYLIRGKKEWKSIRMGQLFSKNTIIRTDMGSVIRLRSGKLQVKIDKNQIVTCGDLLNKDIKFSILISKMFKSFKKQSIKGDEVVDNQNVRYFDNSKVISADEFSLLSVRKLYQNGKYNDIIDKCREVKVCNKIRYLIALSYFELGDFKNSREQLNLIINNKKLIHTPIHNKSTFLISILYSFQNYNHQSIKYFENYIINSKQDGNLVNVYFMLAFLNKRVGNIEKAKKNFQIIVKDYFSSDYYKDSLIELKKLK